MPLTSHAQLNGLGIKTRTDARYEPVEVKPSVFAKEEVLIRWRFRAERDDGRTQASHDARNDEDAGLPAFAMEIDLCLDPAQIDGFHHAQRARKLSPGADEVGRVARGHSFFNTLYLKERIDISAERGYHVDLSLTQCALKTTNLPVHVVNLVNVKIRQGHVPDARARKIYRELSACPTDSGDDYVALSERSQRLLGEQPGDSLETEVGLGSFHNSFAVKPRESSFSDTRRIQPFHADEAPRNTGSLRKTNKPILIAIS